MQHNVQSNFQKSLYDQDYEVLDSEYGMPDRKIESGVFLQGKRILSIGCGIGNDIWYLVERNTVVGVDYSATAVQIAKKHGIEMHQADLIANPALTFDDESFDVVICKDILEHLLEPERLLQEVHRVLRNNGYVVVSLPNHFSLPMRLRILAGKGLFYKCIGSNHRKYFEEWNYMHIRFFTYNGTLRLLTKTGFSPQKWFWDFFSIAHYNNPDMWLEPQIWKRKRGHSCSFRGKLGLHIVRPLWFIFNMIFPPRLRHLAVSMAPDLLCSGFYVRAVKQQ